MAMAAISFPLYRRDRYSSKRYQAAKAMLDGGKMTKSEARSESKLSWRNSACCYACWGRTPPPWTNR